MSDKLVMGYWDCPTCGQKKIKGVIRTCPNCAQPRDEHVKFYMDMNNIEYLTEEESAKKGKGADWHCPYCETLNSALDESCASCGAPREKSEKDYFQIQKEKEVSKPQPVSQNNIKAPSMPDFGKLLKKMKWGRFLVAALILLAVIWALMPKTKQAVVESVHWNNTIEIEKYKEVYENDWNLPSEARLDHTANEIKSYYDKLDHYETVSYQSYEKVGSHTETEYKDNGDGTFTSHSVSVPEYGYVTRTKQEPVYEKIPVYATKYYYYIYKWAHQRDVRTEGTTKETYWGEVKLGENEREGAHTSRYEVTVLDEKKNKSKKYTVNEDIWNQIEVGGKYKIKVTAGHITEIVK